MNEDKALEIDLVLVFRYVWARKLDVFIIVFVSISLLLGSSYLITPIYQAQSIMVPVQSDISNNDVTKKLGGLASIVGIGGDNVTDETTLHMATFRSRKFIREFINENNLMPILYEADWDDEGQRWIGDEPTMWDTVNYFDEEIRSVVVDQETGLITLSVNWTDPKLTVKWAELMAAKINKVLQETFLNETKENLTYLSERLLETQNSESRDVLYSLLQEQIKREMLSKSDQNFAYKVVDPPVVPEKKSSPKRSLFALVGLLLGGIISIIYAYIKERKNNLISNKA
jgi:LPS O-antigen subunit length determinant protein (WzzB/FepE family)